MLMLLEELCCGHTRLITSDCSNIVATLNRGGKQLFASFALETVRDLQTFSNQIVMWASFHLGDTEDEWKTCLDGCWSYDDEHVAPEDGNAAAAPEDGDAADTPFRQLHQPPLGQLHQKLAMQTIGLPHQVDNAEPQNAVTQADDPQPSLEPELCKTSLEKLEKHWWETQFNVLPIVR